VTNFCTSQWTGFPASQQHLSSTRRQNAELARIRLKFVDEEIALKKAQAEMEYKQNVIKVDLDLLAARWLMKMQPLS
jgi:hypothetical protein